MAETMNTSGSNQNSKKRAHILRYFTLFLILVAIAYMLYYYFYARYYVSTDDAYVNQDIIYVSPQISGTIDQVRIQNTQYVKQGELIAKINSFDQKIAFKEAKTALAESVRDISRLIREREQTKQSIILAQIKLKKSKDDLKRNSNLIQKKLISDEKYHDLLFAKEIAEANVHIAKQKLLTMDAIVGDGNISQNPKVQSAILKVQSTYLNLQRCNIYAPISGIVAQKNVTTGKSVSTKTTLLAIIPQEGIWVDANFKETKLAHIHQDQNVALVSDTYGSRVTYHGKVEGISPGTGSVFALIPAQNATGNWIKIIQRIPVRISIDAQTLKKYPLRVGNSMTVTIDIKGDQNATLKPLTAPAPPSNGLYPNVLQKAKQITQQIIEQNS